MNPKGRFLPFQLLDLSNLGCRATGYTGGQVRSPSVELEVVLVRSQGRCWKDSVGCCLEIGRDGIVPFLRLWLDVVCCGESHVGVGFLEAVIGRLLTGESLENLRDVVEGFSFQVPVCFERFSSVRRTDLSNEGSGTSKPAGRTTTSGAKLRSMRPTAPALGRSVLVWWKWWQFTKGRPSPRSRAPIAFRSEALCSSTWRD